MAEHDDDGGGDSLTDRIMARSGPGLYRRTMPDGGEVVTGPTAQRALRALRARAFTMDHTIFVDDNFDITKPEDAALYAHERHHQMESGGHDDGHSGHDAEEVAARAIERMVLHRAKAGDNITDILRAVDAGEVADPLEGIDEGGPDDEASRAVHHLLKSGKSMEDIVKMLTTYVIEAMSLQAESGHARAPGNQY